MSDAEAIDYAVFWLRLAIGDLAAARSCLADPALPARLAAEHAQQAADKALKGMLALIGGEPPRSHDLAHLARQIPEWSRYTGHAIDLNALTAALPAGRYPEPGEPPYSTSEAGRLVADAGTIVGVATAVITDARNGDATELDAI